MSSSDPGVAKVVVTTVEDASIGTSKLAPFAVTDTRLADDAVVSRTISSGALLAAHFGDGEIGVVALDEELSSLTIGAPDRAPCRVVTTTNVTVAGGAPTTYDGVTLQMGDRVLVTGQSAPAQNGIRYVSVLGTGANGTWARTPDADDDGDLFGGVLVYIQEGTAGEAKLYRLGGAGFIEIDVDAQTWSEATGGISDGDYGDVTVSGGGTVITIDAGVIGPTELANISTDTLLGRDTAGPGDVEAIGVTGGIEFSGSGSIRTTAFTGDVTKVAGGTALTIANDAVTYAKMQNIGTTDRLLGLDGAAPADPVEIGVGGGIEFTGSNALQVGAYTGDVTKAAGGTALTLADTTDLSSTMAGQVMALIMFFGG